VWARAPLVVAAAGLGPALLRAGLPRREGVILIGAEPAGPDIWALAQDVGADHVVFLPAAARWLVDRFAACLDGEVTEAPLVAVLGGRGGAGASVLSAALALAAARRGGRPVLVDADPLGGGLDLLMGGEDAVGLRWPDLVTASGRLAADSTCAALPLVSGVRMLSWDRADPIDLPAPAMIAVLRAARRGADLVVADLPRCLAEPAVHALRQSHVALLVVPAEVRACAAAARVAARATAHCSDLRVVVRGPAPAGLPSRDVAAALGLRLEGALRPEPGLAPALDRGPLASRGGRGPLGQFCANFLDRLADSQPAPNRRPA
ncbi:MAG: hypothetical protein M3042_03640, partial [Actinomycetota bacterium]|nr:hypothetical protein [Actinomycetota bacterium]